MCLRFDNVIRWRISIVKLLKSLHSTAYLYPLSIEKGRAVLYRDFVTILWGALLEYITKLETPQSQLRLGPGRSSVISGELKAGGDSICLCLTGALLWPPQKATLDSKHTLSWFVPSLSMSLTSVSMYLYGNEKCLKLLLEVCNISLYLCLYRTSFLYQPPRRPDHHISTQAREAQPVYWHEAGSHLLLSTFLNFTQRWKSQR